MVNVVILQLYVKRCVFTLFSLVCIFNMYVQCVECKCRKMFWNTLFNQVFVITIQPINQDRKKAKMVLPLFYFAKPIFMAKCNSFVHEFATDKLCAEWVLVCLKWLVTQKFYFFVGFPSSVQDFFCYITCIFKRVSSYLDLNFHNFSPFYIFSIENKRIFNPKL